MERDFLGLSTKDSLAMVKEEVASEGCKEIGFAKGLGTQRLFTNKVSAVPHLLSFKVAQEDKTKKIIPDPSAPSAFMSFSNGSVYEPSKRHSVVDVQKSSNYILQDGSHFSLNACPVQHDLHSVHHAYNAKIYPVSNHAISISMGNSMGNAFFSKSHYATTAQSMAGTSIKPQVLGGVPVNSLHSTLPSSDSGNSVNVSGSPAQLTIFYAGTVNVYDGVSPEKAQAIMLLAGNGSPTPNTALPKVEVQAPNPKPVAVDVSPVNQSLITQPCSRLSSPISVSSHTGARSGSGSSSNEEVIPAKTTIAATTSVSRLEPPKAAPVIGSITTTTTTTTSMMPSVPQARKASLARFLEKRKERVMNVAPYNLGKKSPEHAAPLESNKMDVSATAAAAPGTTTTISFFGNQRKQLH